MLVVLLLVVLRVEKSLLFVHSLLTSMLCFVIRSPADLRPDEVIHPVAARQVSRDIPVIADIVINLACEMVEKSRSL